MRAMAWLVLLWQLLLAQAHALEESEVSEIGVTERFGAAVPVTLAFVNDAGREVTLGTLFERGVPVVLLPTYFQCPRICGLLLDGFDYGLQAMSRERLGRDFVIASVSMGPEDTTAQAHSVTQRHRDKLALGIHDRDAWYALTTTGSAARQLYDAVGYRYKKDGADYAHPAAIVVLSPQGTVVRYLYGLQFATRDIELAIAEAASGTASAAAVVDRVQLYCYKYDPAARGYILMARNVVKLGGGITLAALIALLVVLWIRDRRRTP